LLIKGLVKSSLLDYPGRIAASIFCGGCNFRCPNCHNSALVLHPNRGPNIADSSIWSFLDTRHGLLDGVVISGGEPTLQEDLPAFAERVHALGFLVKLDTNGYRPAVLAAMIDASLVDYVAMDIKAPLHPHAYALAAGVNVEIERVMRSINVLTASHVDHEFRTTVVPGILDRAEIVQIAQQIAGANRYYIQQFAPRSTLAPEMMEQAPYSADRLREMATLAREWIDHVSIRGL